MIVYASEKYFFADKSRSRKKNRRLKMDRDDRRDESISKSVSFGKSDRFAIAV